MATHPAAAGVGDNPANTPTGRPAEVGGAKVSDMPPSKLFTAIILMFFFVFFLFSHFLVFVSFLILPFFLFFTLNYANFFPKTHQG